MINTRLDLIEKLEELFPTGRGVEIGVFKGQFSKEILSKWGGTLYMVDVWRPLGDEYEDCANHSAHTDAYVETMDNIRGLEERGIMIRSNSREASSIFADESLDFIYIDANHAYEFVKEDINFWFPKLRQGGIFAGHDYLPLDWSREPLHVNGKDKYIYSETGYYFGIFGVNPAVDEFCSQREYSPNITSEWFGTWWIIK
jgi:hypothetical protein